ncbi:MAG: putative Ig domain-containing protein [Blastocatellia bacterium]
MNFIKRILSSLISAAREGARRRYRFALCALSVAAMAASLTYFQPRRTQAQQTPTTLRGAAALDRLKQDGQYKSLQAALRQARLTVGRAEATPLGRAAWHAPNAEAGYDAYVTEEGVSVALNDKTYVSLSLNTIGYGHAMQSVAPGEVSGDKQTISITREGGVQEWFVNGPDGLEHGFTLSEPPGARPQGVPLRLALRVSDGWRAVASEDGKAVTLRGSGAVVEYGKLVVSDSLGRNIPARLTVAGEQVVIEAEDGEAEYPLTIDPIFTLQHKLVAADGTADDRLGISVALDGDTLAVGALGADIGGNVDQGSVYVFTRSGATWALQQKITAADGAANDYFGIKVALDRDTIVVSAMLDDIGANVNQGSAYVYTRSGGVWTLQQKLTANDGLAHDNFGVAVALDGNTLVAGSYASIGSNVNQGSVYVFTRNGSTWTQRQKLIASDGMESDRFGISVALAGDTLAVGAKGATVGSNLFQGSVYVFTRSSSTWTFQQKLTANDGAEFDSFGTVALDGDTLVVGAGGDDNGANVDQGSAYVFMRSGSTQPVWTQQQKLIAYDGADSDLFGSQVAVIGDTVVIGAPWDDLDVLDGSVNQGSVYVFGRYGGFWTQQQKLTASDHAANDDFGGYGVALSSDTLVVGVPGDDIGSNLNRGSVYVFAVPSCPTLTFAPASLPNGVKGVPYQQQIIVSGGFGPYQFAVADGALPPGLTLSPKGLVSGTPTKQGNYSFTLRATDVSSGCSGTRKYTVKIAVS